MSDEANRKYASIVHSHDAVTLDDEVMHFETLSKPSSEYDIWEETALGLVADAGDYDVLLWAAGYALAGNGEGVWGPGVGAEREIQLIVVPKSQRGTMSDNDFVRVGWTPSERLTADQLKVSRDGNEVAWDFNGLRFVARPPQWALQGQAGGASFDLTYDAIGSPLWNWGRFAEAAKNDRAGYDVFVSANGSIDTGKQKLDIRNGFGVREHIITGQSNNPVKNLPAPNWMWWLYTICDDVKINFFQIKDGMQLGFVKYGELEQINVSTLGGGGSMSFSISEKWEDPRTGLHLPVKWSLQMERDGMKVDVQIAAHGRAYSHWPTAQGTRMYCYLLSTMTGDVQLPDGRKLRLEQQLTVNSFCRTVLTAAETAEGAQARKPG